jgi:hypothetical protein
MKPNSSVLDEFNYLAFIERVKFRKNNMKLC